jgi:hypothetical protein
MESPCCSMACSTSSSRKAGGRIVAEGNPTEVAKRKTATGEVLRALLAEQTGPRRARTEAARRKR